MAAPRPSRTHGVVTHFLRRVRPVPVLPPPVPARRERVRGPVCEGQRGPDGPPGGRSRFSGASSSPPAGKGHSERPGAVGHLIHLQQLNQPTL
ncbi:hypothetical protein AV530_011280 [Patagioenas fasciata monilis]|uniref:Uncharacterized protein n=1 Tax=Patagioenas fasciata monilis TaxID=372326 RepID=A0A1V4KNQ0_PATFA|nr:hypothetical protein AV530_011280 [Patagioenas fasciata monilis]